MLDKNYGNILDLILTKDVIIKTPELISDIESLSAHYDSVPSL